METQELSYSKHFETLIALTTHLAVVGGNEADAANAPKLAKRLDLDEFEVSFVLNNFKGIFRKSMEIYESKQFGKQHKYTLQLRYARRKYEENRVVNVGEPLSNEELFSLLSFISAKVREEQENERQNKSNKITLIGVWAAAALSFISVVVTLLKP